MSWRLQRGEVNLTPFLAPHETQRRAVSGKTGIYPSVSPGKSICVPIDPGGEMVTPFLDATKLDLTPCSACSAVETKALLCHAAGP
jgi:hypothetical protein